MKVIVKESFKGAPEGHTTFNFSEGQIVEGINAKFVLDHKKGELLQLKEDKPKKESKKKNPKPKYKKNPKPDHEG